MKELTNFKMPQGVAEQASAPTPGRSNRRSRAGALMITLGLTVTVVASPTVPHRTKAFAPVSHNGQPLSRSAWQQVGKASWYGGQFNGRKTATGEKFDMHAFTCAHRTLPLGTWVRVTNLINHRFTFLRVNDRGPMSRSLIVDLSFAAAQKLGISGLGKVKIEAVSPATPELAQAMVAQLHIPGDPLQLSVPTVDRPTALVADTR